MSNDLIVAKAVAAIMAANLEILKLGRCPKCALLEDTGCLVRDVTPADETLSNEALCEWYCLTCETYADELAPSLGLIHTHCFKCNGFGEKDGIPCANCEERGYLLAVSATNFREAKPL